jgi:outer membrane lipoprotein-sorting protein
MLPTRRRFAATLALAALFAPFAARPLPAQPIPLAELSRYLNGLQTAEADFTQVNPDGSISAGRVYIHRPGRMRFEYAPPDRTLVLASGGKVAIFDGKSNQPPEEYPLRRTPLSLILDRQVDLGRARLVVAHGEADGVTYVVAQDPERPEYGRLRLIFTADPVALRQWVVTDEAGAETTVILGELRTGRSYGASMFSITAEARRRGF